MLELCDSNISDVILHHTAAGHSELRVSVGNLWYQPLLASAIAWELYLSFLMMICDSNLEISVLF